MTKRKKGRSPQRRTKGGSHQRMTTRRPSRSELINASELSPDPAGFADALAALDDAAPSDTMSAPPPLMISDQNGEKQSGEHSENESRENNSPDVIRRRVAEAIVLALYFIFELPDAWREFHERAILQGVVGVCAVLLIEFPLKVWIPLSTILSVLAVLVYLYAGPTPPQETDAHGVLVPADDPMPQTTCNSVGKDPHGWLLIMLGNASVFAKDTTHLTILKVGDRDAISMSKSENGININLDILNADGNLATRIENNEYQVIPPPQTSYSRRPDRSTLVVYDKESGAELFWIRYMNPLAVKIRGAFHKRGDPNPIKFMDDRIEKSPTLHFRMSLIPGDLTFAPCMVIVPDYKPPIFTVD